LLASFAKDATPSKSDIAKGIVRERTGQQERANAIASRMLDAERKRVEKWDIPRSLDFIGRMESGRDRLLLKIANLPTFCAVLSMTRGTSAKSRNRQTLKFHRELLPHIWEDPTKAKDIIARIMGKRPLEGPASFIKKRTIPTTDEGIKADSSPLPIIPLIWRF